VRGQLSPLDVSYAPRSALVESALAQPQAWGTSVWDETRGDAPPESSALTSAQRGALVASIESGLSELQPAAAVRAALARLADPRCLVVMTGQQPALLGGPLYNLYKALHAIALARRLAQRWQRPVVPMFWNHGDDHDIAELHHAWILNENLDLRRVALAALSSGRTPASRLTLHDATHRLGAIAQVLEQALPSTPDRARALERYLPREGETLARAFTRALLEQLGEHGLIVLEPDWVRAPLGAALARCAQERTFAALRAGADRVRALGHEPAIEPEGAALFYRLGARGRGAWRASASSDRAASFVEDESGEPVTPAELAARILAAPEEWSAAALLRPIVQDLALPVCIYVGGAGELGYHLQLRELRAELLAPRTAFALRAGGTIVPPECVVSLRRLELRAEDVLRARAQFGPQAESSDAPPVIGALRAIAERAARELNAQREALATLDRGMAVQLKQTAEQLRNLVEKLCAKAERVHANNSGKGARHQRRLSNTLVPRGEPQERVLTSFEFVARYGEAWIAELLAGFEARPGGEFVLELADSEPATHDGAA
jgi:bacillithiol biosynthesis cysteine-adding enzyme BshC